MSIALRALRSLFATLPAVLLALTLGAPAASAAGRANSSGAPAAVKHELQVSVQVVRACAVDTTLTRTTGSFDAAARTGLVLATQASLAGSCGAVEPRVSVIEVPVNLVEQLGTVLRLDVEF